MSWNWSLYFRADRRLCHAPRERVSWNFTSVMLIAGIIVTLHVSVWVEIRQTHSVYISCMSRSTWACELKFAPLPKFVPHISHAPRERVSWNVKLSGYSEVPYVTLHVSVWVEIHIIYLFSFLRLSRSTWACELKWSSIAVFNCDCASRSTWACELKCMVCNANPRVTSHAPRERVSWNLIYSK